MHVVLAGSHGLLGRALSARLAEGGHRVTRLVRRPVVSPAEISWDPPSGRLDAVGLAGADAVVNLGGVGVGDRRWTRSRRQQILSSRTVPTSVLARAVAEAGTGTLLQASAVGFYGDRGDEVLTEDSPSGDGFLAGVVRAWEEATRPARDAGVRVVHLRTGIVLSPRGGALGRLLPLLRLGLGGPLGSGRNTWPWITVEDHVRAMEHLLTSAVAGPVNMTGPAPAAQGDVVRAVARELRRPALVRVPRWALRLVLGGFADEVLASQHVLPTVLLGDGFEFRHADLDAAAAWLTSAEARQS